MCCCCPRSGTAYRFLLLLGRGFGPEAAPSRRDRAAWHRCGRCRSRLSRNAQRVEHYVIAGFGTVRTYASLLGRDDWAQLLDQTLDQAKVKNDKRYQTADNSNTYLKATKPR